MESYNENSNVFILMNEYIYSEYIFASDDESDSSDDDESDSSDDESDSSDDDESDSSDDESDSSDDDESDSSDDDESDSSDDDESDSSDDENYSKIAIMESSDDETIIAFKYSVGDRVIKLNGIGKGVKGDVIYVKGYRMRVIKDDGEMFNIQSSANFELFEEEKDKDETVLGECAICMEDIKCCDTYSTNCLHIFHKKCMYPWLYGKKNCINNNDCPMCRQDIIV